MKNKIRFTFFTLFLIFIINIADAERFRAGLTLGVTATDIDGMDTHDQDNDFYKLGFALGGIINTKLNAKNDLQVEINYIKKGTMQLPDSNNNGYYKLALDYIEVPFILRHHVKFNMGKMEVNKFDLELGASVGRLVNSSWERGNYQYDIDMSMINSTDVSLLVGLSYNFSSHVNLNFRYSNSVIPSVKQNVIPGYLITYYYNSGNNMVFQMSLKFIFGGSAEKEKP